MSSKQQVQKIMQILYFICCTLNSLFVFLSKQIEIMRTIYLTSQEFENRLQDDLTIVSERKGFYICSKQGINFKVKLTN